MLGGVSCDPLLARLDTSQLYDTESLDRVTSIFRRFDLDGDGTITYEELASIFVQVDPEHWNAQAIDNLMSAIDKDESGGIHYEELIRWILGDDAPWDEARESMKLRPKRYFSAGDVVFVKRMPTERTESFEVSVDLSDGEKCGVITDFSDGETLLVKHIKLFGALADWNDMHTDKNVLVGDRIYRIIASWYDKDGKAQEIDANRNARELVLCLTRSAKLKLCVQPGEGNPFVNKLDTSYEILSKIHDGCFATVKKVKHRKTASLFACKSVFKSKLRGDRLQQEFEAMMGLDHPNVLGLHEVFEDFQCVHLILPFCEGGELLERILDDAFTEGEAALVMQQLLAGVRYLHARSICHRDLSPDNIMLESPSAAMAGNIKITDFSSARSFTLGQRMKTVVGCCEYRAFEMFNVATKGYSCLCDLWSCGVILYLLLSGYPPFMGETDRETIALIRAGHVSFDDKCWIHISDEAVDLVKRLLVPEHVRLTADEAFRHSWTKDLAPRAPVKKLEETRSNMGSFRSHGRIKKLAMYVMAKRLSADELDELKREFENIDKNRDGTITFHELKDVLDRHGDKVSTQEIRNIFEHADVDGNKRIGYTEFLAAASEHKSQREEEAYWTAFNVFDHDGSGMISRKELLSILKSNDTTTSLDETTNSIKRCLDHCDADKDGMIDFEEFLFMLRSPDPSSPARRKYSEH